MAKYDLAVEKTVKRLIPPFLRKPRQTQWLLSLTFPLRQVNDDFKDFIDETRVEASLTSQTQLFEQYLNDTFRQFFTSTTDKIQIVHDEDLSIEIFFSFETGVIDTPLYFESENEVSPDIFFQSENAGELPKSFRVLLPTSFQGQLDVVGQIVDLIEKYRVSPFDYDIVFV